MTGASGAASVSGSPGTSPMITGPRSVSTISTVSGSPPATSTVSVWAWTRYQPSGPSASAPPSAVRRTCSR